MSAYEDALAKVEARLAAACGERELGAVIPIDPDAEQFERTMRVLLGGLVADDELAEVVTGLAGIAGGVLACAASSPNPGVPMVAALVQMFAAGRFYEKED